MSIISQVAIVLLIVLTVCIITFANKGLRYAQEEGEHFVDEWAMRQVKMEEQKKRIAGENPLPKDNSPERMEGQMYKPERKPIPREMPGRIKTEYRFSRYKLTVKDEKKNLVTTVDVDHYPYTIGRDRSNDLVLDDIYVARKHCAILEEEGQAILRNRGSQNGIYASGKQVEEYPLRNEGHFYIGTYEFIVSETGERIMI